MIRDLSTLEWSLWGMLFGAAAIVWLVRSILRSLGDRRKQRDQKKEQLLERFNPAAASLPSLSHRLSFLVPVPLAAAGIFLLRLLTHPLPGIALLVIATISCVTVALSRKPKSQPKSTNGVSLALEHAYLISAAVFIVGLTLWLFLSKPIGGLVVVVSPVPLIRGLIRVRRQSEAASPDSSSYE